MNVILLVFVLLYLVGTLGIGVWAGSRIKNTEDFAVAGHSLPLYMVITTSFATWFGAETVMGIPAKFINGGLESVVEDPFGASMCLVLVGVFFATRLYKMHLLTIGDFYRKRFGVPVEILCSIIIILSYLGWVGAQITALGVVFSILSGGYIFDIGLAGPLAGLVVAIPVLIFGILYPQPVPYAPSAGLEMGQPLLIQWLAAWLVPERAASFIHIGNTQVNPLLMAGWVGLLVTGLNMMPVGQLDGGHVTFGLMGRNSYWIAVAAMVGAVTYMLYTQVWIFLLMVVLVFAMGLRHPPSSNDDRALGWPRQVIGWCSLVLPILCIPANPIY
jgi:membrane-associated protease RseP (regulator of RpoE activity)